MQTIPARKNAEKSDCVRVEKYSGDMHLRYNDVQRKKKVDMEMNRDGVEVFVILGHCSADDKKRNIADLPCCPYHNEICDGDCSFYSEEQETDGNLYMV